MGYGACSVQEPTDAQGVAVGVASGAAAYARGSRSRARVHVCGFAADITANKNPAKNTARPVKIERFK